MKPRRPWAQSCVRLCMFTVTLTAALLACAGPAAAARTGRIYLFTSNPDLEEGPKGFAGFLRGLGYTVDVEPPGGGPYRALDTDPAAQSKIAELEGYDLVAVHRNFGSATLASSEAEIALWNQLRVPILLCNAPIVRYNRWRWMDADSGGIQASLHLIIEEPDHPIVAGLATDLFRADRVYGGMIVGTDGGPYMTVIARATIPGFDPICMAVWDEGQGEQRPFYAAGNQTYVRRRVFFEMHEYRNNPDAATVDAWTEVSENGRLMFANAVEYAMRGSVGAEVPPRIIDISPVAGTENHPASSGLSFRVTSAQPIAASAISLTLNGLDVTAGLTFTGSANAWLARYEALEVNQAYTAVIRAENASGPRTVTLQFDTIDAAQAVYLDTWDGITFEGTAPPGVYRLYLRAAPFTAQRVSLHAGADPAQALRGLMEVPALPLEIMSVLVPATDALGTPVSLRLGGDLLFTINAPDPGNLLADKMVLALVDNPPAVLAPLLIRAAPAPGQLDASPEDSLELVFLERDTSVAEDSIQLFLGGVEATDESVIVDTADGLTVHLDPVAFLMPGSQCAVSLLCQHGTPPPQIATWEYAFGVQSMPVIPAAYAAPSGSGIDPGFNVRNHMAPGANAALFISTSARAELQLAGQLLDEQGAPVQNEITHTPLPAEFAEAGFINYARDTTAAAGRFGEDRLFPGGSAELIPGNIALEATAYLQLAAGLHRFGVRSDDGFRLTAGLDPSLQDIVLGVYEGPRGDQVPTEFPFLVIQDGVYAVRLLYYDGGGSASLEWYGLHEGLVSTDGADGRVLINGPDVEGLVRVPAYRARTVEPEFARPELVCGRDGADVVIRWTSSIPLQLESTENLASSNWQVVPVAPTVSGDEYTVRLPATAAAAFYRLRR